MGKNTLENKTAFLDQYSGQEILAFVRNPYIKFTVAGEDIDLLEYDSELYLVLKPLSSITDEDAIAVADIVRLSSTERDREVKARDLLSSYITSQVADYLRSKSYALPFRDISVEEQISFGWIKLQTEQL